MARSTEAKKLPLSRSFGQRRQESVCCMIGTGANCRTSRKSQYIPAYCTISVEDAPTASQNYGRTFCRTGTRRGAYPTRNNAGLQDSNLIFCIQRFANLCNFFKRQFSTRGYSLDGNPGFQQLLGNVSRSLFLTLFSTFFPSFLPAFPSELVVIRK